jgi:hypothetical protein
VIVLASDIMRDSIELKSCEIGLSTAIKILKKYGKLTEEFYEEVTDFLDEYENEETGDER